MEPSFDLDINNYTTDDLIKFFKLENTYSLEDLIKMEEALANKILSSKNKYNEKHKFDIINFIKSAKEVLTSFYHDMENNKEIKKSIEKFMKKDKDPRVGRIINPLSSHQTLENQIIAPDNINGYGYNVTTSIYMFNTAARNDYFTTAPANSSYDLPIKWKNVISISLSSANIPNVMYAFNEDAQTNKIYIEEDVTGLSGIVVLPEGNYNAYAVSTKTSLLAPLTEASFPDALTKAINEQILGITDSDLYRFFVEISLSDHKTTISNTTYAFTMNTLRKTEVVCTSYSTSFSQEYEDYSIVDKTKIPIAKYFQTMGFLMGYRNVYYTGSKSYTSESIFTNTYSDYLYFAMDDFTGSQTISNTIGVLGEAGVIDNNILGVIPINSSLFRTTFDNNSNFIYKKREYFGPVDISRINIKLLNQKGNLVNLHDTDFSFSLQVKTLYNLSQHSKPGLRNGAFF
jgi:hypothetical protein